MASLSTRNVACVYPYFVGDSSDNAAGSEFMQLESSFEDIFRPRKWSANYFGNASILLSWITNVFATTAISYRAW